MRASSALLYSVVIADDAILAAGAGREVLRWTPDAEQVAEWLCGLSGSALTTDEWTQYVPGARYTPPCP